VDVPRSGSPAAGTLAGIALFVIAVFLPLFVPNVYHLHVATLMAFNVIVALGLNILFGYTGQVSIGHAGFYAIGAYTTAILSTRFGVSFWLCLPLSALTSLLAGLAWARPTLKLEGAYLTVATIGFGEIVRLLIVNLERFTGGPMGIRGIPRPTIGGLVIRSGPTYYWLSLAVMAVLYLLAHNLMKSHRGRLFPAVRDDPIAAASLGIDITATKLTAFGASTIYAGIAGGLYAGLTGYVAPTAFTINESIGFLAMVVVGGAGSNVGAVLGAVLIAGAQEIFRGLQTWSALVYGLLLMIMMIFAPSGLIGLVRPFKLHRANRGLPIGSEVRTSIGINRARDKQSQ
jgi:branched-chain amino acid transport system permease protein